MDYRKKSSNVVKYLSKKKKVLLLTTSNRWEGEKEIPKSSQLAIYVKKSLGNKAKLIDVAKLKIYNCEGNVSTEKGNVCGTKDSVLKDKNKNPSGCHRCWASYNNKDDELWKISKELLESNAVIFFGSIRWGQTNSIYQKLIERLTWLENRHSTLKEDNVLKNIDAGAIFVGQNWRGANVVEIQRKVLKFFGFKTPRILFWNWQYTKNPLDETAKSYKNSWNKFRRDFGF